MTKHQNNGNCPRCLEILNKYPKFNADLLNWFLLIQAKFPNFHAAEGGRGKIRQEEDFKSGLSKAHYGESSHNYNSALDSFFMVNGLYSLDQKLYDALAPEIPDHISWYGAKGAVFYERPHFEIKDWRDLLAQGMISLVE